MDWIEIILLVFGALVAMPVIAYLVAKFAAAGYFRAKHLDEQHQTEKKEEHL